MPTLEMVHERFARLWRIGLFNLIRRSAELSVRGIELIKFNDYMHSLYVPTNLNLIRFKPLRGTGLIVFEPTLVFAIVDNFFGGDGRYPHRGPRIHGHRNAGDPLLKQTFADLREAWAPVMDVDFEYINSEINPHFANIVTPREYVVVCRHASSTAAAVTSTSPALFDAGTDPRTARRRHPERPQRPRRAGARPCASSSTSPKSPCPAYWPASA